MGKTYRATIAFEDIFRDLRIHFGVPAIDSNHILQFILHTYLKLDENMFVFSPLCVGTETLYIGIQTFNH